MLEAAAFWPLPVSSGSVKSDGLRSSLPSVFLRCGGHAACRGMSRGRSASLAQVKAGSGLKDAVQRNKAVKMADKQQRRAGKAARRGEGDRHIPDFKPKHLFSGKRPKGSTDRR